MFKFKMNKKLIAAILPLCILVCSLSCLVGVFVPSEVVESVEAATTVDSYYAGLNENLTGLSFRSELADLITDTHTKETTYDGLRTIFDESDADPNKSGNIIWFYTGTSVPFNGSFNTGTNREHVWPKNNGKAFPAESKAGSDAHHLRPANDRLNSTRSNNSFGEVPQTSGNIVGEAGSKSYANLCYQADNVFYPGEGFRGATARILMYVQTRWGDDYDLYFVLGKGYNKSIGDIEDLMKWHIQEPPTEAEKRRNEVVYKIQGNRNPFIDHPEYAEMIYCNDGKTYNDELQAVVDEYGSYLDGDAQIEATSVTISPSTLTLAKGESQTLTATVLPAGAKKGVTWTSSNTSVATVSDGVVKALSAGTTTITATSTQNPAVKGTATITVKALSSISLSGTPTKTTYTVGDKFDPTGLTVTATYTDSSTETIANSKVTWLDGATRASTISAGSTSVICAYGGFEKTITGITVKQADPEVISSFATLVQAVQNASGLEAKWTAIGDALEAYNKMSNGERIASSQSYELLEDEISEYNTAVTEINAEADKATEHAIFFYIGAMSVLSYASYLIMRV